MTVYFFYGEEEFNMEKEIEKLKKNLDPNFIEMSFKTYDNPKFADLISILRSQPMMFGRMLILINIIDYFSKSLDDKEIKEISEAIECNNENLDIVFIAELPRNEGKKLDSRKKFFKLLSKQNTKEFAAIPVYKTAEIEAWINKQAKSKGIKITPEAHTAIISQIGNNLRQIDVELDKLKLFAYPNDVISKEMVQEICISNEDIFNLSNPLMQNEKDIALLEYRRLLSKKSPLEILSILQTIVRRWITIKAKSGTVSPFELSKLTGMHEFVVKMNINKLKNTPLKDLVKLKQNMTEAEFRIKSGLALDVEREVENAIFK